MRIRAALGGILCAALMASAAEGKALYVFNQSGSATYAGGANWLRDLNVRYLEGFGATVRVVGSGQVLTDSLRAGKVQEVDGTWTTYDIVIHCLNGSETYPSNYLPKSMTLRAGKPWVPQLFINNAAELAAFDNATTCSTGVSGNTASLPDSNYVMRTADDKWVWKIPDPGRCPKTLAGRTAGTWRPLVWVGSTVAARAPYGSGDYDSLTAAKDAAVDTARAWVIYNRTTDNSAPVTIGGRDEAPNIFVHLGNIAAGSRSAEGDIAALLYAYAWADSLTGGAIFDAPAKLPITVAIGIDDGWKRAERGNGQMGYDPSDSLFIKATLDSMKAQCAAAVPKATISLGVEVDSLDDYPQDFALWRGLDPYIVYTPHIHGGTTSGDVQLRSATNPLDLFASSRPFGSAVGPCSTSDADTASLYCNLYHARTIMESRFGREKVDRIIQPASDRTLPNGTVATGVGGTMTTDSVIYAIRLAGFRGWRFNALSADNSRIHETNTGTNASNTLIWDDGWQPYAPNGVTPFRMRAVGMPGYSGVTPRDYGQGKHYGHILLTGLFGGWGTSSTLGSYQLLDAGAVVGNGTTPIRLLALHVSELGSSDLGDHPIRQQYWSIKHLIHATSAINEKCGKTLIRIGRPDEIDR